MVNKQKFTEEEIRNFKHLFSQDPLVGDLLRNKIVFSLTGGAVVDIMESRIPKDYDFVALNIANMIEKELPLEFKYKTSYSTTYTYKGHTIQVINSCQPDFDYTISQITLSNLSYNEDSNSYDKLDFLRLQADPLSITSYRSKTLIPVGFSAKQAANALYRLPHWIRKGYEIRNETYLSLLSSLTKGMDIGDVNLHSHS